MHIRKYLYRYVYTYIYKTHMQGFHGLIRPIEEQEDKWGLLAGSVQL